MSRAEIGGSFAIVLGLSDMSRSLNDAGLGTPWPLRRRASAPVGGRGLIDALEEAGAECAAVNHGLLESKAL